MSRKPYHLAVIVCEEIQRDPNTGKVALVSVVHHLVAPSLPCPMPGGIGVYIAVTELDGPVRIGVQLVTPDGTELAADGWNLSGKDPLFVHECAGVLAVTFGATGMYTVRATADGDMLAEWRFQVSIAGGNP
jgi:hypothetical protein